MKPEKKPPVKNPVQDNSPSRSTPSNSPRLPSSEAPILRDVPQPSTSQDRPNTSRKTRRNRNRRVKQEKYKITKMYAEQLSPLYPGLKKVHIKAALALTENQIQESRVILNVKVNLVQMRDDMRAAQSFRPPPTKIANKENENPAIGIAFSSATSSANEDSAAASNACDTSTLSLSNVTTNSSVSNDDDKQSDTDTASENDNTGIASNISSNVASRSAVDDDEEHSDENNDTGTTASSISSKNVASQSAMDYEEHSDENDETASNISSKNVASQSAMDYDEHSDEYDETASKNVADQSAINDEDRSDENNDTGTAASSNSSKNVTGQSAMDDEQHRDENDDAGTASKNVNQSEFDNEATNQENDDTGPTSNIPSNNIASPLAMDDEESSNDNDDAGTASKNDSNQSAMDDAASSDENDDAGSESKSDSNQSAMDDGATSDVNDDAGSESKSEANRSAIDDEATSSQIDDIGYATNNTPLSSKNANRSVMNEEGSDEENNGPGTSSDNIPLSNEEITSQSVINEETDVIDAASNNTRISSNNIVKNPVDSQNNDSDTTDSFLSLRLEASTSASNREIAPDDDNADPSANISFSPTNISSPITSNVINDTKTVKIITGHSTSQPPYQVIRIIPCSPVKTENEEKPSEKSNMKSEPNSNEGTSKKAEIITAYRLSTTPVPLVRIIPPRVIKDELNTPNLNNANPTANSSSTTNEGNYNQAEIVSGFELLPISLIRIIPTDSSLDIKNELQDQKNTNDVTPKTSVPPNLSVVDEKKKHKNNPESNMSLVSNSENIDTATASVVSKKRKPENEDTESENEETDTVSKESLSQKNLGNSSVTNGRNDPQNDDTDTEDDLESVRNSPMKIASTSSVISSEDSMMVTSTQVSFTSTPRSSRPRYSNRPCQRVLKDNDKYLRYSPLDNDISSTVYDFSEDDSNEEPRRSWLSHRKRKISKARIQKIGVVIIRCKNGYRSMLL